MGKRTSFSFLGNRGQASTEYMLMLLMIVTLFITLFKGALLPALQKLSTQLEKKIETLYSGDNLHQLHFRIPR